MLLRPATIRPFKSVKLPRDTSAAGGLLHELVTVWVLTAAAQRHRAAKLSACLPKRRRVSQVFGLGLP